MTKIYKLKKQQNQYSIWNYELNTRKYNFINCKFFFPGEWDMQMDAKGERFYRTT